MTKQKKKNNNTHTHTNQVFTNYYLKSNLKQLKFRAHFSIGCLNLNLILTPFKVQIEVYNPLFLFTVANDNKSVWQRYAQISCWKRLYKFKLKTCTLCKKRVKLKRENFTYDIISLIKIYLRRGDCHLRHHHAGVTIVVSSRCPSLASVSFFVKRRWRWWTEVN